MNELTELALRLVSIDSVNPDLVPGGAGEREIAQFVADWLRGPGWRGRPLQSACGVPVSSASPGAPGAGAR